MYLHVCMYVYLTTFNAYMMLSQCRRFYMFYADFSTKIIKRIDIDFPLQK